MEDCATAGSAHRGPRIGSARLGYLVHMTDLRGVIDLSAPRLSELRLQTLIVVLSAPGCRSVLARFLDDPWQLQGSAEYCAHDLDVSLDLVDVPRYLVKLRHGGWLHQRPAAYGLASRLRRDDLERRFPDTMHSLHAPTRLVGARRPDPARIEVRLRRLAG